jgi:hypothetical protein
MGYSLVLSDTLFQEFHAFKHGLSHDAHLIEKLLHLYKPPLLTNVEQLRRTGVEDTSLMAGLASAGFVDQSLPDLCKCTFYKFILDNGRSDYPFVDVSPIAGSDPDKLLFLCIMLSKIWAKKGLACTF